MAKKKPAKDSFSVELQSLQLLCEIVKSMVGTVDTYLRLQQKILRGDSPELKDIHDLGECASAFGLQQKVLREMKELAVSERLDRVLGPAEKILLFESVITEAFTTAVTTCSRLLEIPYRIHDQFEHDEMGVMLFDPANKSWQQFLADCRSAATLQRVSRSFHWSEKFFDVADLAALLKTSRRASGKTKVNEFKQEEIRNGRMRYREGNMQGAVQLREDLCEELHVPLQ